MFPLGCGTGCYQAAAEAEADVDCLLAGVSCVEEWRPFVMGYVAVATCAFVDVLNQLAGKTIVVTRKHEPEAFDRLRRANEAFKAACDAEGIEERLRRDVRNRVTAHREQQSLESHHQSHLALTDPSYKWISKRVRVEREENQHIVMGSESDVPLEKAVRVVGRSRETAETREAGQHERAP